MRIELYGCYRGKVFDGKLFEGNRSSAINLLSTCLLF